MTTKTESNATEERPRRTPSSRSDGSTPTVLLDEVLPSAVEAISPAVSRVIERIKSSPCAPDDEYPVELALQEALANAVVHGNRLDPRKKVRLSCACRTDRALLIVVKDQGRGFDPAQVPNPLVGPNLYSNHGRGLFLISKLMDEVRFEHGGTELHLIKR